MKYLKYFLIAGITIISFASNTSKNTEPSEGIYPGDLFPTESLEKITGEKVSLTDLKGQKVLVNFWAAYDARSHRDNVLLANVIKQENYPVKMISLSFDASRSVFEKTVQTDKVEAGSQFWIDHEQQKDLLSLYKLKNEFKSYLIDEEGKIIVMNPSAKDLGLYFN